MPQLLGPDRSSLFMSLVSLTLASVGVVLPGEIPSRSRPVLSLEVAIAAIRWFLVCKHVPPPPPPPPIWHNGSFLPPSHVSSHCDVHFSPTFSPSYLFIFSSSSAMRPNFKAGHKGGGCRNDFFSPKVEDELYKCRRRGLQSDEKPSTHRSGVQPNLRK